jgi:hypothetical protein
MTLFSTFLAYKLINLLSRKWEDWPAFKLGLIDCKGNLVRKPFSLDERRAFGIFENMARNIKKIITLVTGKTRAAAILSTIYLMKEENQLNDKELSILLNWLSENYSDIKDGIKNLTEETNCASCLYNFKFNLVYIGI